MESAGHAGLTAARGQGEPVAKRGSGAADVPYMEDFRTAAATMDGGSAAGSCASQRSAGEPGEGEEAGAVPALSAPKRSAGAGFGTVAAAAAARSGALSAPVKKSTGEPGEAGGRIKSDRGPHLARGPDFGHA